METSKYLCLYGAEYTHKINVTDGITKKEMNEWISKTLYEAFEGCFYDTSISSDGKIKVTFYWNNGQANEYRYVPREIAEKKKVEKSIVELTLAIETTTTLDGIRIHNMLENTGIRKSRRKEPSPERTTSSI